MDNVLGRQSGCQPERSPGDGDSASCTLVAAKCSMPLICCLAYNPPSASTPEISFSEFRSTNAHQSAAVTIGEDARSPNSSRLESELQADAPRKDPLQLRQLAKGALLSLAPHNIRYGQLAKEGVDQAVLRELYEEIGIRDPRTDTPKTNGATSTRPDLITVSKLTAEEDDSEKPGPTAKAPPVIPSPVLRKQGQHEGYPGSLVNALQTGSDPRSVQIHKADTALERKDRIAQLLAAKTGRPLPVRGSVLDSTLPMNSEGTSVPAALPLTKISPETPPLTTSKSSLKATVSSRTSKESLPRQPSSSLAVAAEQEPSKLTRNKAQTELVRQKMEALRKEALANAQAQTHRAISTHEAGSTHSKYPVALPLKLRGLTTGTPEDSHTAPENAQPTVEKDIVMLAESPKRSAPEIPVSATESTSACDVGPGPVFRIPGLFMTTAESVAEPKDLEATSPIKASDALTTGVIASQSYDEFITAAGNETPASPARSRSGREHQGKRRLGLETLSRDSSETRNLLKRPLAAASFDELLPSSKRPFGRQDSIDHIEIVLSGDESDNGSGGVLMDLDEESQNSAADHEALDKSASTEENDMVTVRSIASPMPPIAVSMPPASIPLPPRPSFVTMAITNPPSAVNTPAKEKETEDLYRMKSQEIELMRQRIAELEQRKSRKRPNDQRSPQISVLGTPLPVTSRSSVPVEQAGDQIPIAVNLLASPGIQGSAEEPLAEKLLFANPKLQPVSKKTLAETDSTQANRLTMLTDGVPPIDPEVQNTRLKLAQVKARLSQARREAQRREAEILEEARKLEEQLQQGLCEHSQSTNEFHPSASKAEAMTHKITNQNESVDVHRSSVTEPVTTELEAANSIQDLQGGSIPCTTSIDPAGSRTDDAAVNMEVSSSSASKTSVMSLRDSESTDRHEPCNDVEVVPGNKLGRKQSIFSTAQHEDVAMTGFSPLQGAVRDSSLAVLSAMPVSMTQVQGPDQTVTGGSEPNDTVAVPEAVVLEGSSHMEEPMEKDEGELEASVSMSDSGSGEYEPDDPSQEERAQLGDDDDVYEPADAVAVEPQEAGLVVESDDDYEPAEQVDPILPGCRLENPQTIHMENATNFANGPENGPQPSKSGAQLHPNSLLEPANDTGAATDQVRVATVMVVLR